MQSRPFFLQSPAILFLRRAQLITALCIYCSLLLLPSSTISRVSLNDLLLHGVGNFLLFSSLWLSFNQKPSNTLLLFITIAFSGLMELLQSLGSREASLSDLAANSSGAFIAFSLCCLLDYSFIKLGFNKRSSKGSISTSAN